MYYIRFLKAPKLSIPEKPADNPTLKCLVAITTDLGDALYPHSVTLQVQMLPVAQPSNIHNIMTIEWKPSMRVLPIEFALPSSKRLALQKKTALSAFSLRVKPVDERLEAFTELKSGQDPSIDDGDAVMSLPIILAAQSTVIDAGKGVVQTERVVKRRIKLAALEQKQPTDDTEVPVIDNDPEALDIWEESGEESLARRVWPAAMVLAELLDRTVSSRTLGLKSLSDVCKRGNSSETIRAIELGTGCGVAGIALAKLVRNCDVLLTDLQDAEEIVGTNISQLGRSTASRVRFGVLDWFKTLPSEMKNVKYDIVLVADCTYNPDSIPDLVKTIDALISDNREAKVVVAGKRRHPSEAVFGELLANTNLQSIESLQLLDGRPGIDGELEDIPVVYVNVYHRYR